MNDDTLTPGVVARIVFVTILIVFMVCGALIAGFQSSDYPRVNVPEIGKIICSEKGMEYSRFVMDKHDQYKPIIMCKNNSKHIIDGIVLME